MPRDLVQRVNLDLLHGPFLELVLKVLAACRARGADYFLISGYRSFPEQASLYFQGRTKPGKKVTNAKPGESFHNYGLAVDCCRDANVLREGLQPDWDLASYKILQEEAERVGLESGMSFKTFREGPHIQFRLPAGVTLRQLKDLFEIGGLDAAWKLLGP